MRTQIETPGRYVLWRELGGGGLAHSYLAAHLAPDGLASAVVIKRVRSWVNDAPSILERLLERVRCFALVDHPCSVPVFDVLREPSQVLLVSRYVAGLELTEIARLCGSYGRAAPRGVSLRILADACAGVDALQRCDHGRRVTHGALRPSNIVVGFSGCAQVLDAGIAAQAFDLSTVGELSVDQARFIAPDALESALTRAARRDTSAVQGGDGVRPAEPSGQASALNATDDVYALGVLLGSMLTLRSPWDSDAAAREDTRGASPSTLEELLVAKRGEHFASWIDLDTDQTDRRLVDIARAAISPDASDRPSDPGELGEQLEQLLQRGPIPNASHHTVKQWLVRMCGPRIGAVEAWRLRMCDQARAHDTLELAQDGPIQQRDTAIDDVAQFELGVHRRRGFADGDEGDTQHEIVIPERRVTSGAAAVATAPGGHDASPRRRDASATRHPDEARADRRGAARLEPGTTRARADRPDAEQGATTPTLRFESKDTIVDELDELGALDGPSSSSDRRGTS